MPDITMCANKKCPLRDMRYRYRAIPDRYQAYALFEPKKTLLVASLSGIAEVTNCALQKK